MPSLDLRGRPFEATGAPLVSRSAQSYGNNWSGDTSGYSVASNRLDVGSGEDIYWNVSAWGANQEAFVTLTTIDPNGGEQDLLLKSQSSSDWTSGVLEVWYDAAQGRVQVWTYTEAQNWVQRGGDIAVTFANGDQLGARATADGQVKVYRNGTLLATRDVTGWPYYAEGGYIGLWYINASDAVLDDFGGGTAAQASLGPDGGRARGLAAPAPDRGPNFLTRLFDWLRSLFAPTPPRAVNAHPPVAVPHAGPAAPLSTPPEGQTWRTYYYAGATRIAMRVETSTQNDVYYLHGDHLGSASLATDSNGAVVPNSPTRYYPFGETRYGGGGLPTDQRFTGQAQEAAIGLYYYGARWYDPSLYRFLSADTIVPSPSNPQTLNRYAYTRNNPVKYNDPTGHDVGCNGKDCAPPPPPPPPSVYWRGKTEVDLAAYEQYQGMYNDCGPFSVAVAINMLTGSNLKGHDVAQMGDVGWLSPAGGTRLWPGGATVPGNQANLANWINTKAKDSKAPIPRFSAKATKGTPDDLRKLLTKPDEVGIVTLGWKDTKGGKKAGHAEVIVAYDPAHKDGPWGLLNWWDKKPDAVIRWMSDVDFQKQWNYQFPAGIGGNNLGFVQK